MATVLDTHTDMPVPGVYRPKDSALKIDSKILHHARAAGAFGGKSAPDASQKSKRCFIVSWVPDDEDSEIKLALNQKHNIVIVYTFKRALSKGKGKAPPVTSSEFGKLSAGAGWIPTPIGDIASDRQRCEVQAWCALITRMDDSMFPVFADGDPVLRFMNMARKVCSLAEEKTRTLKVASKLIEVEKRTRKEMNTATKVAVKAAKRAKRAAQKLLRHDDGDEEEEEDEEKQEEEEDEEGDDQQEHGGQLLERAKRDLAAMKYKRDLYAEMNETRRRAEVLAKRLLYLESLNKRQRVSDDLRTEAVGEEVEEEGEGEEVNMADE